MTSPFGGDFSSFLEDVPRASFFSFQDQFGGGNGQGVSNPAQERFFQSQFSDIYNQYLGNLGRQIRNQPNQMPTGTFTGFLSQPNFFRNQFQSLPPSFRGINQLPFAPPSQWVIPR
jgi:hypothetical protein